MLLLLLTGNGTDFGDLSETVEQSGFVGNATRGVRGGGQISSGSSNVLEYWTIDTNGNAQDFGDLTVARQQNNACCSSATGRVYLQVAYRAVIQM